MEGPFDQGLAILNQFIEIDLRRAEGAGENWKETSRKNTAVNNIVRSWRKKLVQEHRRNSKSVSSNSSIINVATFNTLTKYLLATSIMDELEKHFCYFFYALELTSSFVCVRINRMICIINSI